MKDLRLVLLVSLLCCGACALSKSYEGKWYYLPCPGCIEWGSLVPGNVSCLLKNFETSAFLVVRDFSFDKLDPKNINEFSVSVKIELFNATEAVRISLKNIMVNVTGEAPIKMQESLLLGPDGGKLIIPEAYFEKLSKKGGSISAQFQRTDQAVNSFSSVPVPIRVDEMHLYVLADDSGIGSAIGGGLGGAASIAIIIGGVIWYRRRRRLRREREKAKANEKDLEAGKDILLLTGTNSSSGNKLTDSPRQQNPEHPYIQDILIKKLLGGGNFGEVYEGLWRDVTPVALKKLREEEVMGFENEFSLLKKLNHPNVVKFFGLYQPTDTVEKYIVMELLSKGNLLNFLRREEAKTEIKLTDLVFMAVNVAAGMDTLHQKNIVHRDLATRNLLVTQTDGKYIIKVADFGMSREMEENYYNATDRRYPVKWSPPEVIQKRQFSFKSDIWSYGVVLWEIFEWGNVPYLGLSNSETIEHVLAGNRLPKPFICSDAIYSIMQRCWSTNPKERPDFREIFKELSKILLELESTDIDTGSESEGERKESLLTLYLNNDDLEEVYPRVELETKPVEQVKQPVEEERQPVGEYDSDS